MSTGLQTFITIPEPLKQQLVKDHDAVRKNRNIRMPRSPCVLDILDSFKEHASEQQPPAPDIDEQVASGICNFFDRALALVRSLLPFLSVSEEPCLCMQCTA